jgi:hypothetical protein
MGLLEKDKRKFTVIIGSKKCGSCCGAGPSLAAKKVKGKSGTFYLKETTKGSKKKLYGPYSSKKKVVQRGGTLREDICEVVLKILKQCDKEQGFEGEMKRLNDKYKILEKTYLFLGISRKQNKCNSLKEILRLRNFYSSSNVRERTLCHCLCSIEYDNIFEIGFFVEHKGLIKLLFDFENDRDYDNFYKNHWEKLVKFLRITIRQIELEILEQNKKNRKEMKKKRNQLEKKNDPNLNRMRQELRKAMNEQQNAQGGPANVNSNNEAINKLRKAMNEQQNAQGGPANVNSNNEAINKLRKAMNEQQNAQGGPANQKSFLNNPLMQTVGRRR